MKNSMKRLLAVLTTAMVAVVSVSAASADTITLTPKTETLYIAAGCPPDATGTCTSTRWLGKRAGDATSNYTTSITPVDEVFYQAEGSLNWRDYASDNTLRAEGYKLRAAENIVATVSVAGDGPAINNTVHARIEALTADNKTVEFAEQKKTATQMPASTTKFEFAFDIPDTLEGTTIKSLTFFVAMHGVNANAGHIDQEGGSTLKIPYYVETVVPDPTPTPTPTPAPTP